MTQSRIKHLSDVLKVSIGNNKKIIGVEETPLIAPGENYGSFLLRLDIKLQNEDSNEEEELNVVAKLIPKDTQNQQIFGIQYTVKKEIQFYDVIVPALQEFQREHGVNNVIDCFPKFYGGRLNLHGKDEIVDEDSVIILENLVVSGFRNVDRQLGYDLEAAKIIIKNLASLHAIPLAMKLKDPKKFEEVIRSKCVNNMEPPPPPEDNNEKSFEDTILEILYESDKCLPYISKLKKIMPPGPPKENEEAEKKPFGPPPPNEPWGTLFHSDMWINNQMLKFENGKPVKAMIVDFQMYSYSSPANDLFFFLWTSIQKSVLEEHLDDLLKFYHDCFIEILHDFKCDVTPFSFPKFLEQVDIIANFEFMHALFMMFAVVLGKKGGNSLDPTKPNFNLSSKDLSVAAKERIWYCVQECGKRNWIEKK